MTLALSCSSQSNFDRHKDCLASSAQVSQAKTAITKEQQLKEQLREQMASATNDSKRQASADLWRLHSISHAYMLHNA